MHGKNQPEVGHKVKEASVFLHSVLYGGGVGKQWTMTDSVVGSLQ